MNDKVHKNDQSVTLPEYQNILSPAQESQTWANVLWVLLRCN